MTTQSDNAKSTGTAEPDAARLEIDLGAVEANLAEIRRLAGPARKVIATVKADAYGHGCVAVGRRLQSRGVEYFAVGTLGDAAAMRAAGITTPILLLSNLRPAAIGRVLELGLIATVTDADAAGALARAAGQPVPVFVKVDCGFGRYGVPLAEAPALMRRLASVDGLDVEGLYTHNSFSDPAGLVWAKDRLGDFAALLAALDRDGLKPRVTQAVASASLFAGLDDPGNAVAVGSVLFGINPVGPTVPTAGTFRPAMTALRTRLAKIGPRPPDGQAAAYLRNAKGPIGVAPIGLSNGYRPTAPEAFAIVAGRKAPLLRTSLEAAVFDLAGIDAALDDEVLLLGEAGGHRITIEMLAGWQGTSVLMMTTGLGHAVPRHAID